MPSKTPLAKEAAKNTSKAQSFEKPSLAYFDLWHQHLLSSAIERRVISNLQAGRQKPSFREILTDVLSCQHIHELESTTIKFLHASSLRMCEAALAPDAHAPEFPARGFTLWLQPLTTWKYRDAQIVGIFVHRPFDAVLLEHNPYLQTLSQRGREWLRDFQDLVMVYIITTSPDPGESEAMERIVTHKFGEYEDGAWRRADVEGCPTHACTLESLAEDVQVPILCPDCAQELEYWSRVITTLLWVVGGRLRQPHDTAPNVSYSEILEQKDLLTQKKRRRRYVGEIIQYDASYFRVKPRHHVGPLSATHEIVTPEEAGHLEIDEARVLVYDWTDIDDYKRTLRHPKFYPDGKVPTDVLALRRVDVQGKKHKRQLISLELWKAREARRAAQRKQHLVHAPACQAGQSPK